MGINRISLPQPWIYPDMEQRSVFLSAPHPVIFPQHKTLREKFAAWFERNDEERCMTDEELRHWSNDDFHPRLAHPRVREGAPHDASQRNNYRLCVTMAHPLKAHEELERLLNADMLVITRIETASRVLSERLFRALQGVELRNIAHAPMVSAAKACAEVVLERFERQQRHTSQDSSAEDVLPWRDDDDEA